LVDQLNIIDEQWAYSEYHLTAKAHSDFNTENAMLLLAKCSYSKKMKKMQVPKILNIKKRSTQRIHNAVLHI
jgi:hypothetical protein